MADDPTPFTRARAAGPADAHGAGEQPPGPADYREAFGEELTETLNVDGWRAGRDLGEEYRRIENEVAAAVAFETEQQQRIREYIFPKLPWAPAAPPGAGVYRVELDEIAEVHQKLLFPGGVEACDGTSHLHDALALTIHQIGVSLVSYHGDQGTWCQRLFRRDLRQSHGDRVERCWSCWPGAAAGRR